MNSHEWFNNKFIMQIDKLGAYSTTGFPRLYQEKLAEEGRDDSSQISSSSTFIHRPMGRLSMNTMTATILHRIF